MRSHAICLIALALAALSLCSPSWSQGNVKVVTTLPHLAYLARQIGGGVVEATPLTNPRQDPHYVNPKPTLMKACRGAHAFIEVGMQLELWADQVVNGSGNSRLYRGQPGRIIAYRGVRALELPVELSREWGDIHPQGNPHIWLDPLNVKVEIDNIVRGLSAVSPANASTFQANGAALKRRIDEALFGPTLVRVVGAEKLTRLAQDGRLFGFLRDNRYQGKPLTDYLGGWLKQSLKFRGARAVTYHKTWAYFAHRFGISIPAEVEERPGIPPGPRHQARLLDVINAQNVRLIMVCNFYDLDIPRYLAGRTNARVVVVPLEVGGEEGVNTYFDLIDRILLRILGG